MPADFEFFSSKYQISIIKVPRDDLDSLPRGLSIPLKNMSFVSSCCDRFRKSSNLSFSKFLILNLDIFEYFWDSFKWFFNNKISSFDFWKCCLTSIINHSDILLTRKALGCEQKVWNLNYWSWKIKSTWKVLVLSFQNFLEFILRSPTFLYVCRSLCKAIQPGKTVLTVCLGIALLLASFSPFQLWSLCIILFSIANNVLDF